MPPEPLVMNTKFRSRNVVIGALRARYTLKPCCILAQGQLSTYDSPASMRMLRDFAAPMSTLSPRDIRYSHVMDVSASGTSWLGDFSSDIGERRVSWAEAVFSPRPASVFLFRCSREKLSGTGWTVGLVLPPHRKPCAVTNAQISIEHSRHWVSRTQPCVLDDIHTGARIECS